MSKETDALIAFMKASGVRHRVTSTTGGRHAPTSYHFQGLAVDFAGPEPSRNSPALQAIFDAFVPVEHQLAELAYLGAAYNIKNGRRVKPYDKDNHVHVAIRRGVILAKGTLNGMPDDFPPGAIVTQAGIIAVIGDKDGYRIFTADGAVFAFGNAQYLGRVHVPSEHRSP